MHTWESFVTGSWAGPVCLGATVILLILSIVAWFKKGTRSGLRGIAWSLLPFAAYLTHSLALVGRIVSAIVQFAGGFVFSPKAWFGVVLVAVSAVLFLVSGGIPLVRWGRRHKDGKDGKDGGGKGRPGNDDHLPAAVRQQSSARPGDDDDLSDVRDILRKHGIS